ncbi:MAG: riboflavin synthase [Desulfobacteraceae bacterium]|nr:riboflavin synthase [Desulfobacteraceae bacterium]
MFTGIIEGLGTVRQFRPAGEGKRMTVEADFDLDGTRIGDSIAVNGACLTAVRMTGRNFEADVSPETLSSTTFGTLAVGGRVNLERALRFSDRIDGHLVSGHVDGVGTLHQRGTIGNAVLLTFRVEAPLARYLIRKGSVAVDGVSLTVNRCDDASFAVSIIPHTLDWTTLGTKKIGDPVNIETDMIGKYVERFLQPAPTAGDRNEKRPGGVDMAFLVRTGFLK